MDNDLSQMNAWGVPVKKMSLPTFLPFYLPTHKVNQKIWKCLEKEKSTPQGAVSRAGDIKKIND